MKRYFLVLFFFCFICLSCGDQFSDEILKNEKEDSGSTNSALLKSSQTQENTQLRAVGSFSNGVACGGTLISKNYIMTAAHCLVDLVKFKYRFFQPTEMRHFIEYDRAKGLATFTLPLLPEGQNTFKTVFDTYTNDNNKKTYFKNYWSISDAMIVSERNPIYGVHIFPNYCYQMEQNGEKYCPSNTTDIALVKLAEPLNILDDKEYIQVAQSTFDQSSEIFVFGTHLDYQGFDFYDLGSYYRPIIGYWMKNPQDYFMAVFYYHKDTGIMDLNPENGDLYRKGISQTGDSGSPVIQYQNGLPYIVGITSVVMAFSPDTQCIQSYCNKEFYNGINLYARADKDLYNKQYNITLAEWLEQAAIEDNVDDN